MNLRSDKRRGLGMGLSALLGDIDAPGIRTAEPTAFGQLSTMPIELLAPSTLQPRRQFDEQELEALASSLREKGVLQPLVVREAKGHDGHYEIVAGERRWRAAQIAGLHELPVIIRELGDVEVLELALVENLQRADLNPLEEAQAYRRLVDEFGHAQESIATAVGKSRSHVANTMRLLVLPEAVLEMVRSGQLSAGHARALIGAVDPLLLASEVVTKELNVRETEALARRATRRLPLQHAAKRRDPNLHEVEERLAKSLGLAVSIKTKRRGGTLAIRYTDLDQLEDLLKRLTFSG